MINGVPYPYDVKDEASLLAWISSIDRETDESTIAHPIRYAGQTTTTAATLNRHREVYRSSHFKHGDDPSEEDAKRLVCQQMAMELFAHLIHVPHGKLVWRIRPEFDVSFDSIPSDLSQVMDRRQVERALGALPNRPISLDSLKKEIGKEDWATDFSTDSIYPVAAPVGEWRIFKSYMRYSVVLNNEVMTPRGVAT